MNIATVQGDATSRRPPAGRGLIVAHLCNDCGAWGAGFVLALDKISSVPRASYLAFCKDFGVEKDGDTRLPRGTVQFVSCRPDNCEGDYIVANMIAQNGVDRNAMPDGNMVDYDALKTCLVQVMERAYALDYDVHIPRGMGAGLAGGDQAKILQMIEDAANEVEPEPPPPNALADALRRLRITLWEFVDTKANSFVPVG